MALKRILATLLISGGWYAAGTAGAQQVEDAQQADRAEQVDDAQQMAPVASLQQKEPEAIPRTGLQQTGLQQGDLDMPLVEFRPTEFQMPLADFRQMKLSPAALAAAIDTTAPPLEESPDEEPLRFDGRASYYGYELAGRPTANGERFDPEKLTAAHRTLPFGTRLRVTNVRNGRSVVVRVNDRGPFVGGRILDLSYGAAREIGMIRRGTARVQIDVLD